MSQDPISKRKEKINIVVACSGLASPKPVVHTSMRSLYPSQAGIFLAHVMHSIHRIFRQSNYLQRIDFFDNHFNFLIFSLGFAETLF